VNICRSALAALLLALVVAAPASAFAGRNGVLTYEGRASAASLLYLRNADGSGVRLLRTPGRPSRPAFSPLGRRLAFAVKGQIWVMQADGRMARQITSSYLASDGDPAWSPRGDAIVFSSGPSGARDIFTVGADGDGLRRLTAQTVDEQAPAWSGRDRIAFVRHTDAGDGDLWTISPTGATARRVTKGPADDREPAWSPDGRRVVFTRGTGKGHRDLFVADASGRHLRRIAALPRPASTPVWSPNGKQIAFAMGPGKRRGIWLIRPSGKGLRQTVKGSTDARALDWQVKPGDPVVAGAGDIACDPAYPAFGEGFGNENGGCHQRATSNQLLRMDLDAVLMLGDMQYEDGTAPKIEASYAPSWGRVKELTHPVVGNHEYADPGATAYYDYFNGLGQRSGPAGDRSQGWYSFDLGRWHVIALNSNCGVVSCAPGGPQEQWLRADLAAHPTACTLALMHHPLYSSGRSDEAATPEVAALWQALYDGNADLVLSGHDHAYERFAPQNAVGVADPVRGMRQFIVGTGGKTLQGTFALRPNSEVRGRAFGVIRVGLHARGYDWMFLPDRAGAFVDSGTGACH
jgi:dipeptidyl aminopeptidase/acylaminoacyl peptidase